MCCICKCDARVMRMCWVLLYVGVKLVRFKLIRANPVFSPLRKSHFSSRDSPLIIYFNDKEDSEIAAHRESGLCFFKGQVLFSRGSQLMQSLFLQCAIRWEELYCLREVA